MRLVIVSTEFESLTGLVETYYISQIDHKVSVQMLSDPSTDTIYKCKVIGPSHNDRISSTTIKGTING